MAKPGPAKNKPPAALVNRIVHQEAKKYGADPMDVLFRSHKPVARAARTAAIERIMAATGCSHGGLEKVWGGHLRKLSKRFRDKQGAQDQHATRLAWQYGPERAGAILAGRDRRTQLDLAAWRRLGGERAA